MDDADEDIDPLMGPVAELMAEHHLSSSPAPTASTDIKPSVESIEALEQKPKLLEYFSFLNIHSHFKNIFQYILDRQWSHYLVKVSPKIEQELIHNPSPMYSSLKTLSFLFIIYAIITLPLPYLFHSLLILYIFYLFLIDLIYPLYIYSTWFQCLKSIRQFLNTIDNHRQWLITIHGFQLIRPTSSLFENQLYQLRYEIFKELQKHFLFSRQISQQYLSNFTHEQQQLICSINLEEFGPLIQINNPNLDEITNKYDQISINSLLKLLNLQINESIQLIHINRPRSYLIFKNYKQILIKSIENLNKIKQNCSIMINYIDTDKTNLSSKKFISSYFLLRSNCEQLFQMNEKNSSNSEQIKRIIQDLKTVVYILETMEIKSNVNTDDDKKSEQILSNDEKTNLSNITSYHRFDDQIQDTIDEILICDTGKLNNNNDEDINEACQQSDYNEKFVREQTNYLMKELQTALQGKKQEWSEREQRLLGYIDDNKQEENVQEKKTDDEMTDEQPFEKVSSLENTMTMLDELKHSFVLNKKKLNINEDVFGEEEEENFGDDDDDEE